MAQKKNLKKNPKSKKRRLKEIPRPTKTLICMAVLIIMLSGYGILSNIVHSIHITGKVEMDYSNETMVELKSVLHEMNTDLIQLNQAKGSSVLTKEEFESLKKDINNMIENVNQLSYITKTGTERLSFIEQYEFYLENQTLSYSAMLRVHKILSKLDSEYTLMKSVIEKNIENMKLLQEQAINKLYYNYQYTSFDDHNVLGSVRLELTQHEMTEQITECTINYVHITSTMLKTTLGKGGLYYE